MGLLAKLNEWADKKWAEVNDSIPQASFFSIDIRDVESRSKANWSTYYEDLNAIPKDLIVPKKETKPKE
tara:strand:+ start:127 stop:333 length:207 start_codon:yes stop_codon:yes gene_type:complete